MDNSEIELQALICEREGMVAENLFREQVSNGAAYCEDSFLILAEKMRALKRSEPASIAQQALPVKKPKLPSTSSAMFNVLKGIPEPNYGNDLNGQENIIRQMDEAIGHAIKIYEDNS